MSHLQDHLLALGFWGAHLAIWAVVFAESGLLVGFFLPGDSLLFTSGFLASQGFLNLGLLLFGCSVCAVLGDSCGYYTGRRWGRNLFERRESWLFRRSNLLRAEKFYADYGRKTILIARFLPVVRTFAPVLAGISRMDYRTFLVYNLVGGIGWGSGLLLLGYFLGQTVPHADHYILLIVGLIIIASVIPPALHLTSNRSRKRP